MRGFSSRSFYGERITSVYSVNKVEETYYDTYFNPTQSNEIKVYLGHTWANAYWVLKRIKGIVYLYINNELLSKETSIYNYDSLNIYGMVRSIPSKIANFSIKQL